MRKELGDNMSKKLQRRLSELKAAGSLSEISYLPPPRLHALSGNRSRQFSVDLDHPYRLLFIVANEILYDKKYSYNPDFAVLPGETLLEVLESQNLSQKDIAIRTGLTVQTISRIISGNQPISYSTANSLEMVTKVPAKFWNNLEANYREQLAKLKEKKQLNNSISWLKNIPTNEIFNRGYVKKEKSKIDNLRNILTFYGVNSVEAWEILWKNEKIAARRSHCYETIPEAASAWIRMGEIEALKISTKKYNKVTFKSNLKLIKNLTIEKPEIFIPKLINLCANSGVALSLIPKLDKVPWNGASKWITPDKALIILNIRGKTEDKFWFSFFHEAGHILHDSKKGLYIADGSNDPIEIKANNFSENYLIPKKYNSMISEFKTRNEFIKFAKTLNISVGIVVGRYHYITKKWYEFTDLINKFQWV